MFVTCIIAVFADVARREDVCTSLVYKWRRVAQREEDATTCGLSPVIIETPAGLASLTPTRDVAPGVVEVDLGTARVKIGAGAPPAVIATILKALRR